MMAGARCRLSDVLFTPDQPNGLVWQTELKKLSRKPEQGSLLSNSSFFPLIEIIVKIKLGIAKFKDY